ncbi:hypothetical protein ROTAS13_03702 [Roseomonas sp. TAS13]|uniref:hypothetical protein n=1 Tax=Roseomonas TaxID=125216 RepID=UPI00095F966A|nr:hypothetical protein [Roseomonas sp. TAS13]GAV36019.1 hypothetical protein ROTAS13_03702 [Roseomonas sp. TAS13]
MLLAAKEALPGGRIDHGWAPEALRPRPVRAGALTWIAAGVAGLRGLSLVWQVAQAVSEQVLGRIPVLQHIAAAVPGSSVTALLLSRLANVTAEACCPLSMEREG